MLPGKPPPSGERWLLSILNSQFSVATRCQAVDVARKTSTVWRTVATLNSQFSILRSHPLPSGGCCEEDYHRLANGGYGRAVATQRLSLWKCDFHVGKKSSKVFVR
jgi:hypothetical protein